MRYAECHPDRRYYAKGLCNLCYASAWLQAHPVEARAIRQREYRKNLARYRASSKRYYDANAAAIREKSKAWSATHPDTRLNTRRVRDYGFTSEEYRDHLIGQAGRCLICLRVPDTDLTIDHDHATGKVRGLLCHHCNRALGHLRDDPESARRAGTYLELSK